MSAHGPDIVEADLTLVDGRLESGVGIEVGPDGRIVGVGSIDRPASRRLLRRAVMPGMVNAHSHAFQRGLRGRGETFGGGANLPEGLPSAGRRETGSSHGRELRGGTVRL